MTRFKERVSDIMDEWYELVYCKGRPAAKTKDAAISEILKLVKEDLLSHKHKILTLCGEAHKDRLYCRDCVDYYPDYADGAVAGDSQ